MLSNCCVHYSKSKTVFKKIASAVCTTSPHWLLKGAILTDGKTALSDSLAETTKKAKGLRCFNHFRQNCKDKLTSLGVRKPQEQAFFLNHILGKDETSIIKARDENDLNARINVPKKDIEEEEKRITQKEP